MKKILVLFLAVFSLTFEEILEDDEVFKSLEIIFKGLNDNLKE